VEAESAENEVTCVDGRSRCAAACFAALSEETWLAESPVKMMLELVEAELFAELVVLRDFLAGISTPFELGRMVV
jgi:hypothetical protein